MRQDAISADPDIQQAVEFFVDIVGEIRARSAAKARLKPDSPQWVAEGKQIDSLNEQVSLREFRLGLSKGTLIALCTHIINVKARRGRGEPSRPTVRTLMDEVTFASSRESTALRELERAKAGAVEATRLRIAAEEAYSIFTGGPRREVAA